MSQPPSQSSSLTETGAVRKDGVLLHADWVVVCRGPGGVDPVLLLAGADLQPSLLRAGRAPVVLVEPLQMIG